MLSAQCNLPDPDKGLIITKSTFLCGDILDGYTGKLPDTESPVVGQPASLCEGFPGGGGKADNVLWFSFIATSFQFDIDIFYSNCGADPNANIQVGVYGDTEFNEKVVCNSFPNASPANLWTDAAIPGKVYYLYIDGYETPGLTSTCDFRIEVNSGINTTPYIFDWKDDVSGISTEEDGIVIQDNHNVCSGNNIIYNYQAPTCEAKAGAFPLDSFSNLDLYCYEWTIEPAGSGVILGDPNAREIDVDWQVPGDYVLSVEIFPHDDIEMCSPSLCLDASPINVFSRDITQMTADTIYVCSHEPYPYCGELIAETTTITCIENTANCIEVVQPFKLLENDTVDYGTFVNCGSEGCFELFGIEYCTPGEYLRPDKDVCNIFHKFIIEGFNIDIDLPTTVSLDCDTDDLLISPEVSTNYTGNVTYEWRSNGVVIGNDINLSVSETGAYEFKVIFPDLESVCEGTAVLNVVESMGAPKFDLNIPVISCLNPIGMVEFVEIDPIASLMWEGANGFVNTNPSFTLNQGGTFTLSIIGENGCVNDTTFTVLEDKNKPLIELTYGKLTCLEETTTASFISDLPVNNANWIKPNGLVVAADELQIALPGDYEVSVIANNGCVTRVPFTVEENKDMPTANAGDDQMWQCNTKELSIDGVVSSGPLDIEWTFVEKGIINTPPHLKSIVVGSEGTYILNVINSESGCETSDSMNVFRNENVPDSMEVVKIDPSCFETEDGLIQVINVEGGTAPFKYFLNGIQAEDDFMDNLTAGLYEVMVLDSFDCQLVVEIEVEQQPEIIFEMPDYVTIGYNELYTFVASHNTPFDEIQSVNWFDANGNLIGESDTLYFKTIDDTTISLEVTNINGCSNTRSIPVEVDIDVPVFAPNIFSPNDDGVNDRFTLYARDEYPTKINSLAIFNRWGEQVFLVQNLGMGDEENGWDGRKDGQALNNAVFTYAAVVELIDGTTKLVRGEVTLLR